MKSPSTMCLNVSRHGFMWDASHFVPETCIATCTPSRKDRIAKSFAILSSMKYPSKLQRYSVNGQVPRALRVQTIRRGRFYEAVGFGSDPGTLRGILPAAPDSHKDKRKIRGRQARRAPYHGGNAATRAASEGRLRRRHSRHG